MDTKVSESDHRYHYSLTISQYTAVSREVHD